jgi:hypothetical protein
VAAHHYNLLPDMKVDETSAQEVDKLSPHESAIVGTNARTPNERAQRILAWKPQRPSLEDEILLMLAVEAQGPAGNSKSLI